MSNLLVRFGWLCLMAIGAAGWAFKNFYATEKGRRVVDGIVLKLPILGLIMRKIAVARFCRTLSTLISSGVPDSRRPRHHGPHLGQRRSLRTRFSRPARASRAATPSRRRSRKPTCFRQWWYR